MNDAAGNEAPDGRTDRGVVRVGAPRLAVRGATKAFHGVTVLRDVGIDVWSGEIV